MRFSCDKCNAKYSIADEKLRGKILRVRCKKCGNIIELKEPPAPRVTATPAPVRSSEAPRPATRHEAHAHPSGGALGNLDAEFEQAFGSVVGAPRNDESNVPLDSDRTVLFDYSKGILHQARGDDGAAGARVATAVAEPVVEWYLAIDGQQVGPLGMADVKDKLATVAVTETTYAWRDGMANWAKVLELPELMVHVPQAPGVQPEPAAPSIIEAQVVSGGAVVAQGAAAAPAPAAAESAPARGLPDVEIDIDDGPQGAEPVEISGRPAAQVVAPVSPIPMIPERPRERRVSVGVLVALFLALAVGVVVLLGVFDIIHIPFISSDPEPTGRRPAPVAPPMAKQPPLRDPLLDRDAPRIVIERVPDSRAPAPAPAPAKARRASPPSSAAAPKEKPPETEAARPKEPKPEKSEDLSKLEKRIFAGRAAPGMPKLPEHLVGTDSVPAAAPKGLSDEVISEWIKKYKGGIQSCYARQLKKDPSVKGKLTLNLKIGKNGRVKSAGVEDAMKNTEVGQCVVRVARTWRFPQSGDDADIYYPLVFEKTY